jgi:hypothetical protein
MGVQVPFDSAFHQKIFAVLEITLYGGIAANIRMDSQNLSPFRVETAEVVQVVEIARSRLKAAPTVESLSSALYRLQQMTAKRLDPMTPKAYDAMLDES